MTMPRVTVSSLVAGALLASGVAAAGALTAGGALAARSTSPAASPSAPAGHRAPGPAFGGEVARPFGGRHGLFGALGAFGTLGSALHGEFVVQATNGKTFQTLLLQRGTISAISGNNVTVKSSDGYTLTWTITTSTALRSGPNSGTVKDLATGQEVSAVGPKSTGGATALLMGKFPVGGPAAGWRHGNRLAPGSPNPSTPPSSSSSNYSSTADSVDGTV